MFEGELRKCEPSPFPTSIGWVTGPRGRGGGRTTGLGCKAAFLVGQGQRLLGLLCALGHLWVFHVSAPVEGSGLEGVMCVSVESRAVYIRVSMICDHTEDCNC